MASSFFFTTKVGRGQQLFQCDHDPIDSSTGQQVKYIRCPVLILE
jgi:hypothetical protein